ncbi:MAG: EamA family transporter [Clostridiaceae bacterium]
MFFLLGAILFSSSLFVLYKFTEKYKCNRYAICFFNFGGAAMLSLIFIFKEISVNPQWINLFTSGLIWPVKEAGLIQITPSVLAFLIGFINGFLYFGASYIVQVSTAMNGSAMTSTFNKLGVMVPAVLSVVFFREVPEAMQVTGVIIALAAILIINLKKEENSVITLKYALFGTFFLGGFADFTSKIYQVYGIEEFQSLFIFFTFVFSLIITGVFLLINDRKIKKADIIFGLIIGVPSQLVSLFLLRSLTTIQAFVVFPLFSVGVILVVNVINLLFFKEKLNTRQFAAIGFILVAIVLLNI